MANMREIRARIKSVESTRQITRAMKMVSVAKMRRAQSASAGMDLYVRKSRELLDRLCAASAITENRFLTPRQEIRHVCYVLFVGNRGLCGTYNQAILRYARELLEKETHPWELLVVGRWGRDVLEREGVPVRRYFDVNDAPDPSDAVCLTEALKELYLQGEADEVYLIYQEYRSALRQTPVAERLLPAVLPRDGERTGVQTREFIFEPSPDAVLDRLATSCWQSCICSSTEPVNRRSPRKYRRSQAAPTPCAIRRRSKETVWNREL